MTLVYQYRLCYTMPLYCTGCVTQCRCIVPAHYHAQLYSVDQSREPVAHPYHARGEVGERHVDDPVEAARAVGVQVDI